MARWQPARADVIAEYAREVLEIHPRGRIVIGLDGIESVAAGTHPSSREAFAADLAAAFALEGVPARAVPMGALDAVVPVDDPARFNDESAFRSTVLTPYRKGALEGVEGDRAVLVVSGAFLHFGDLAGIWHTSTWLQVPRDVARERDATRLPSVDLAPWNALVDLAFRRLDARKLANATFGLSDPQHPRREFEDAC